MPEASASNEPIFQGIHISKKEYRCLCCHALPPDLLKSNRYDYYASFMKWERIRTGWGRPIPISRGGGYRCPSYQYSLIMAGKTKATVSPHSFWALDNDFDNEQEVLDYVKLCKEMYPEIRLGYKKYLDLGMSFVHQDEAYLIQPRASESWMKEYEW